MEGSEFYWQLTIPLDYWLGGFTSRRGKSFESKDRIDSAVKEIEPRKLFLTCVSVIYFS